MAGELDAVVRTMLSAVDRKDWDALLRLVTDDVQAVDEISRRWVRSREDMATMIRQIGDALEDIRSEIGDVHETAWGDTGLVTCWLEQDYTLHGQQQHVSAPTSYVLRREGDGWRVGMLHSIPLPEAPSA